MLFVPTLAKLKQDLMQDRLAHLTNRVVPNVSVWAFRRLEWGPLLFAVTPPTLDSIQVLLCATGTVRLILLVRGGRTQVNA